jgi:hypothetical protein
MFKRFRPKRAPSRARQEAIKAEGCARIPRPLRDTTPLMSSKVHLLSGDAKPVGRLGSRAEIGRKREAWHGVANLFDSDQGL